MESWPDLNSLDTELAITMEPRKLFSILSTKTQRSVDGCEGTCQNETGFPVRRLLRSQRFSLDSQMDVEKNSSGVQKSKPGTIQTGKRQRHSFDFGLFWRNRRNSITRSYKHSRRGKSFDAVIYENQPLCLKENDRALKARKSLDYFDIPSVVEHLSHHDSAER